MAVLPIERLMMGMREIKLSRPTTRTRYMVSCIAWASNRRGNVPWKLSDKNRSVSQDIYDYLDSHNVELRDWSPNRIGYVMNVLAKAGNATIKATQNGITEFAFKPDVITTGYTPDFRSNVITNPLPEVAGPGEVKVVDSNNTSNHVQVGPVALPLPNITPPRYLADEINSLLDRYAVADPEGYADWADNIFRILRSALND